MDSKRTVIQHFYISVIRQKRGLSDLKRYWGGHRALQEFIPINKQAYFSKTLEQRTKYNIKQIREKFNRRCFVKRCGQATGQAPPCLLRTPGQLCLDPQHDLKLVEAGAWLRFEQERIDQDNKSLSVSKTELVEQKENSRERIQPKNRKEEFSTNFFKSKIQGIWRGILSRRVITRSKTKRKVIMWGERKWQLHVIGDQQVLNKQMYVAG